MRLLAALLVLCPFAALSQTPEAAPAAPEAREVAAPAPSAPPAVVAAPPTAPVWAIGGGIVLDRIMIVDSGSTILFDPGPELTASLERQLSSRDWLSLGFVGSVLRFREGASDAVQDFERLAVRGGIRRVLTKGATPVELSLLAVATVGGTFSRSDPGSAFPTTRKASWGGGAELGLVVERRFGGGLALRAATPLVKASWDWQMVDYAGAKAVRGDVLSANFSLAPRLELWMTF